MRFGTYNLASLFGSDTVAERQRLELVCGIIRGLKVDVLAVQGLQAPLPELAAERLDELARRVGMTVYHGESVWDSSPGLEVDKMAVGISPHDLHLGLLWNPVTVSCVPGTFRSYPGENMHHGLIKATFGVLGSDSTVYEVQHGSTHLTPFGPYGGRADEAVRVASAFTRPLNRPPGLVGGSWNTVSADRDRDGNFYDHDPYAGCPWRPEFVYQCRRDYDDRGRMTRWWADRTPGQALLDGGLLDARTALHNATLADGGVRWQPNAGHHSDDTGFGPRRVNGIRCTAEVVPALRAIEIAGGEPAVLASDHLPEVVDYDPAAIAAGARWAC